MNRNSFFIIAVIVVGLVGASYTLNKNASQAEAKSEEARDRAELRNDYLEQVGWIRSDPDADSYRSEVKSFLSTYFKSVDDHVARFNLNANYDDYLTELAQRGGNAAESAGFKQNYETVKSLFDRMRQGKYAPIWTATDKGMRLDVLSDEVEGDKVRLVLVLWGAQRQMHEDERQGGGKILKMVTSASFNTSWKLLDAKGKEYGEMTAGDPSGKIDYPERYVSYFPPQVVIGHYDVDRVPASVAKMEITFGVTSSAPSGGTAAANFVWKLDTLPPEWKLGKDEAWKGATETTRADP